MKNEERILELLTDLLKRADHTDEQIMELKERFNKVEWRHDDLTLKLEEMRYQTAQNQKQINNITIALANLVALSANTETRVRRLERPDDTPDAAA